MNALRFTAIHAQDVTGRAIDDRAPSEERLRECVFRILEGNVLCSIGTVFPAGSPHINTAYFSYSETLKLYFLSHPDSLHCRNLSSNPSMVMTVFCSAQRWTEPGSGVQLFGASEVTSGSNEEEAERSYATRFPGYTNWKTTLKEDDLAREYRFYLFTVSQVKILDEKNLGDAVWVVASVDRDEQYAESA